MATKEEAGNNSGLTTLETFLADNPQDNLSDEVEVSSRLTAAGFKFKISAPTGDQFSQYQKEAISIGRRRKMDFDSRRLNELLIVNHTLVPNFRSTAFLQALKVTTPEQAVNKVLKAGEIQDLSTSIQKLAGFQAEDGEGLDDQAKN